MDILKLNPVALWVTTTLGSKLMFADFKEWELHMSSQKKQNCIGDFIKRVSVWQLEVLKPLTSKFIKGNLPLYASSVINELKQPHRKIDVFDLHAKILISASQSLIECVTDLGVGKNTYQQIQEWFTFLDEELIDMLPFQSITEDNVEALKLLIQKFSQVDSQRDGAGEYPFFHHKILFIHIAHIVQFLCVDEMIVDVGSTSRWEHFSGEMFTKAIFPSMGDKVKDFPLIELPVKLLQTHGNSNSLSTSIPSVAKNHADIMCMMLGRLRTIANEKKTGEIDLKMVQQFEWYVCETMDLLDEKRKVIFNREKTRRCERRKRRTHIKHYRYKPMHPMMDRDVFIMGRQSFFYLLSVRGRTETHVMMEQIRKGYYKPYGGAWAW